MTAPYPMAKLAEQVSDAQAKFEAVFAGDACFTNPADARSAAAVIEAALDMVLMLAEHAAIDAGDLDAPSAMRHMRDVLWQAIAKAVSS